MGLMASLADRRVTSARVTLPAWGRWYADATVDGEFDLTGRVTLKVADLTLSGTILSGGKDKGRSFFRVVAGAGGWGKNIAAESYDDDAGVKLSTIIGDAARAAGETIDASTLPSSARIGPRYARKAGPASSVLELHAPRGWYVDEQGTTRIGARPASTLIVKATHGPVNLARGTVELASDSIATILPGLVVDGLEAVDVVHELTESKLRSTIWGARTNGSSRMLDAFRTILEQLDPDRKFRGVTEYRVVTQEGEFLNLQPELVSTGMPDLPRVHVRPGVSGCRSDVMLGSLVLVGFVNADPSRPYVAHFEGADGEGFIPLLTEIDAATVVKLADGVRPMPATGDLAGGIWPIVGTTRVMG